MVDAWRVVLDIARRGEESITRTFEQPIIAFGREAGNDVVLPTGNVSRRHCQILVGPDGDVWARDLGSSNGMWVNGERPRRGDKVPPVFAGAASMLMGQLVPGDVLYVGDFRVRLTGPAERVAVPARPRYRWRLSCRHHRSWEPVPTYRSLTLTTPEVIVGDDLFCNVRLHGAGSRRHALRVADGVVSLHAIHDGATEPPVVVTVGEELPIGNAGIILVAPPAEADVT